MGQPLGNKFAHDHGTTKMTFTTKWKELLLVILGPGVLDQTPCAFWALRKQIVPGTGIDGTGQKTDPSHQKCLLVGRGSPLIASRTEHHSLEPVAFWRGKLPSCGGERT